ncbi:FAD-binding protein [Actinocrispum sp. NPDC049592]|uniref:FAD-binding protein n=1 Tax=Actinocrispum sp. NPDC049592 TaxID=3154835 RepID=UPI00342C0D5C
MIITDADALAWASDDYGHRVHLRPAGVLRPSSAADIQAALAAGHRLRPRGEGHSTAGQAQVPGGVVVDMRGLNAIGPVHGDTVTVGAGARWSSILATTLPEGLTPPVLTDYLELSAGGTLSAGGIGGAAHQHGLQVDNVLEMEVLTNDGCICTCGPGDELFDLVRGGRGEHGIILSARLPLIPAPTHARRYVIPYPDLPQFLADQRALMASRRFSYLEGQAKPGWSYEIEAVSFYTPPAAPAELPPGLPPATVEDLGYFDFLNRVAEGERLLRQIGDWARPHPWADLMLPDDAADAFLGDLMAGMTVEDLGEFGVFLIYPFDTTLIRAPQPRVPATPAAFLVALLRTAQDASALAHMLELNDRLRSQTLAAGGSVYQDWCR